MIDHIIDVSERIDDSLAELTNKKHNAEGVKEFKQHENIVM